LGTYYIPLSSFSCSVGSLSTVKGDLSEVVVSVERNQNSTKAATTANNKTMPSVGYIGFTKSSTSSSPAAASYVLFASQYEEISGASSEPYLKSKEGGEVYHYSIGDFTYTDYSVTHNGPGIPTHQSYGSIYKHTEAVTSADYFGWWIKAPNNGYVNASQTNDLVIQVGNAQDGASDASPNSHMTFTIDLRNNGSNLCSYDLDLVPNSRPSQSVGGFYGLRTYTIPLSSFSGSACNMSSLKSAIYAVSVRVVGGKDSGASSSTTGNETFPVFGFIAFSK